MKSTERILLVDDDPNVLKAYERRLRRRFDVETALCSEEGVTAVNFLGPFAVIISDMAMPREDGARFLERMLDISPDSVRIMLTGNADQSTAVQAVNQARVFRFLNKPCQADELETAIQAAIEEHRRTAAERELMSQTVHGIIAMLTRVLSLASPIAFGKANRLKSLAGELAEAAEIEDAWELEIAASFSQLGAVTLSETTLDKVAKDHPLNETEEPLVRKQYETAAGLIREAPRFDAIAEAVALQEFDTGTGGDVASKVRRNAELLRVALVFDHLTADLELNRAEGMAALDDRTAEYDPAALDALRKVVAKHDRRKLIEVSLEELTDEMQLIDHVETDGGAVLIAKGHEVTATLRERLSSYAESHELKLPIKVLTSVEIAERIESQRGVPA